MQETKKIWCFALRLMLFMAGPFALQPALAAEPQLLPLQAKVVAVASEILNHYAVSYKYGGHSLRMPQDCEACSQCLLDKGAKSKQMLSHCPVCQNCSLDCSHFTQLVYERAGMPMPYLPTASMRGLSAQSLRSKYNLVDAGLTGKLSVGDLLVYKGHVVILLRLYPGGRGDIVHATPGRHIRSPGEGIQRESNVELARFRGPLERVLRHVAIDALLTPQAGVSQQGSQPGAAQATKQAPRQAPYLAPQARQLPPRFEKIPKRQKSAN